MIVHIMKFMHSLLKRYDPPSDLKGNQLSLRHHKPYQIVLVISCHSRSHDHNHKTTMMLSISIAMIIVVAVMMVEYCDMR